MWAVVQEGEPFPWPEERKRAYTFTCEPSLMADLETYARERGSSRSEAIRWAIYVLLDWVGEVRRALQEQGDEVEAAQE